MIMLPQRFSVYAGVLFSLSIGPISAAHSAPALSVECDHSVQLRYATEIFRNLAEGANWTDKAEYDIVVERFQIIAPAVFAALGPVGKGQLQELLRALSVAWTNRKTKDIALYSIESYQFLRAAYVEQTRRCLS